MVAFFPRQTVEWRLEEPPVVRRLVLGLGAMAVVAGVVIRLYRLLMLNAGNGTSGWFLLATYAGETLILLALATAHLGNYPVKHWLWRAPLFGLCVGATEAAVSAALIAAGMERLGTDYAHGHDWASIAQSALLIDTLAVSVFAVILAGVVQAVRYALLKHEDRAHTAQAIHEDHVRHPDSP